MGLWQMMIAAAVLYGLHNIFVRLATGAISDRLGALVLEGTAALILAGFFLAGHPADEWRQALGKGWGYSLLAGCCVGLGTLLYFMLFSGGGELSVAAPVVLTGGTLLMVVAGLLFFKESFSVIKAVGLSLSLLGLFLLRWA